MKRMAIWPAAALATAMLGGCVGMPRIAGADIPKRAAKPAFDPMAFFAGRSEGRGRLKVVFSGSRPTLVRSSGQVSGGVLRLTQEVTEGEKRPRMREWLIREVSPGRYAGTLSDAAGPVSGERAGNRLHLSFPMKGGFAAEQWLTIAPDGRRAWNVLKVRKFGITVAVLGEDIRRLD